MRICLVGPTAPYRGGIAHFTTLLACALDRIGHEVKLISYSRQYPRWLYPGRTDREVGDGAPRFADVEYRLDSTSPASWLRVATRIRSLKPDCVITQWWAAFWTPHHLSIAGLLRSRRRPVLLTICHNATEHDPSRWKVLATRLVLGLADLVVTHSERDRFTLSKLLKRSRILREPHPTYRPLVRGAGPVSRREARLRLGLAGEEPVILFFGFVRRYKGLDVLLDSLVLLRRKVPARLLVAGEFWVDRETIEQQISRNDLVGAVTIHDRYIPVSELTSYFSAADLAVFPYRTSSQSGAVQLAAGSGCPYIASDAGGLGEGGGDHLFPAGDVGALAAKMEDVLTGAVTIEARSGPTFEEYARLLMSSVEGLEG